MERNETSRRVEPGQCFLLALGARLRHLADLKAVKQELGHGLSVSPVAYLEVEKASGVIIVARGFTRLGTPNSKGEYELGHYPEVATLRRAGRPPALTDLHADDLHGRRMRCPVGKPPSADPLSARLSSRRSGSSGCSR